MENVELILMHILKEKKIFSANFFIVDKSTKRISVLIHSFGSILSFSSCIETKEKE